MNKREKAASLLSSGRVVPYRVSAEPVGVRCHVTGEDGVYDVAVWKAADGRIHRRCTCDYCEVHPVACDCSHSLAVQTLIGVPL